MRTKKRKRIARSWKGSPCARRSGRGSPRGGHVRLHRSAEPLPGKRDGAPVFTIETDRNHESWAFLDGIQFVDSRGEGIRPLPTPLTCSPKTGPNWS